MDSKAANSTEPGCDKLCCITSNNSPIPEFKATSICTWPAMPDTMSTTPGQAQNKYRLDAKKDLNMAISPFY
jgi:hypothetical protein